MVKKLYIVFFISFHFEIFAAEKPLVPIKFINHRPHPITLQINGDSQLFGVGQYPVIYANIDEDQPTVIYFEEKTDEQTARFKLPKRIDQIVKTDGAVEVGKSATFSIINAYKVSKEADILAKELALRAKYLKEVDGSVFKESIWNIKAAEETAQYAKELKLGLGLGVANIAVEVIDWGLGDSYLKKQLIILPSQVEGYRRGKMLVAEIGDTIEVSTRSAPRPREGYHCIVESKSKYPLICTYRDKEGDTAFVRLHSDFPLAEITLNQLYPWVDFEESISHENSTTHYTLTLAKAGLSAGIAVVDPFPVTKAFSAGCAVSNFYTAATGLAERFLANRCVRYTVRNNSHLYVVDQDNRTLDVKFRILRLKETD